MENSHIFHLIFQADPVVQLVLLILITFSVVSWAIIAAKYRQLKNCENKNERFLRAFWDTKQLDQIPQKRALQGSPAHQIFLMAQEAEKNKQNVERSVRRAYEAEIDSLEYAVPFLATTASAAPFIGLFGTVWGILVAFWKIGEAGTSSLAVVGPHIAEALIATAAGLAAAIPAVIFYNTFVHRIRHISKQLEDFLDDLLSRLGSR